LVYGLRVAGRCLQFNKKNLFKGVIMVSLIPRCLVMLGLLCPALALAVTPMIAASTYHSLALKSDGTVMAWGYNSSGELGDGTTMQRTSPVAVTGLNGVVAVAAGGGHSLALKSDGTVMAWGHNDYGQLGDSTTTNRSSPVAVAGLAGVLAVAAGPVHG
jgi:alpha-tubulin suppressor-like RCC1 family protein